VLETFARILRVDLARFDQLARAAPPGAGGVVLLPYLDGERTPNMPDATGTLSGLRSDVTPEQLARAAVEGVVCGLLDAFDALRISGTRLRSNGGIVLVGGGSRSQTFPRVLADLTGLPVTVISGEPAATGACVQAAATLQQAAPDEVASAWGVGRGRVVEPEGNVDRRAIRSTYGELRDRYT
jgi:xylulokinase